MSGFKTVTKGIIKENPVFRLVLGTCPTLAVTTSAENAIGMGAAVTLVLMGSNAVISLLRKVIPDKVRIPAYITIISGFVTIVQMLLKAYLPAIDKQLGIFIPLIVVNCIILARAEMFANKNNPVMSILDGVGMGIGFTLALLVMGSFREILRTGPWFGMNVTGGVFEPTIIMILPPGGFLAFGFILAAINKFSAVKIEHKGCESCPMPCGASNNGEEAQM